MLRILLFTIITDTSKLPLQRTIYITDIPIYGKLAKNTSAETEEIIS